jgi:hypothetical protein
MSRICIFALLTAIGAAYAQTDTDARVKARHDMEDEQWARKSGLPASEVRAIRLIAGISDTTLGAGILNIDAITLKPRNHILLAEAGNGHCMRLHVLERNAAGFTEIWSLNEVPPIWSHGKTANRPGNGICSQAPKAPNAHAMADGRIVLEVPILSDPFLRVVPVSTYSFTWNGSKYELVDE